MQYVLYKYTYTWLGMRITYTCYTLAFVLFELVLWGVNWNVCLFNKWCLVWKSVLSVHTSYDCVYTPALFQTNAGVRRFTKPPESLERSLEMSRQRGRKKTQKRPNYKNVGEEEEEDRGAEEGPEEEKEKAKGTEASSKASRTSGDTEGEWQRMNVPPSLTNPAFSRAPRAAVESLSELAACA